MFSSGLQLAQIPPKGPHLAQLAPGCVWMQIVLGGLGPCWTQAPDSGLPVSGLPPGGQ